MHQTGPSDFCRYWSTAAPGLNAGVTVVSAIIMIRVSLCSMDRNLNLHLRLYGVCCCALITYQSDHHQSISHV